ncbi:hypothetical protein CBM2625_U40014 [Cupriavidus taiwanensis]|uniref:Uncharacterized protein n=1 Tax=Cupriavidus taiwanensis TaxID=164546 RepID=A0A375HFD9_9BURK|nr:hypothetical protein CBM2625_U40014 [Cupriavidus taiwanensis]SPD49103.1 protein of unknown function [Cupriavidus taiwanensis]
MEYFAAVKDGNVDEEFIAVAVILRG